MTRLFYASTFFGVMSLAAAIDAGLFGEHDERRLLIMSNNAAIPEVADQLDASAGAETLLTRFDATVSWNDVIAPLHPSDWRPRAEDLPLLRRLIADRLGLDDQVTEVVLESIAVAPAHTIALLVPDAAIRVFSDGLMSYGPTRNPLPEETSTRIEELLYLDLVPELEPLLLRETRAVRRVIPDDAFAKVLGELPVPDEAEAGFGAPAIVGQYLSALGIVTSQEETALHASMLRALAAAGHRHVVFKPHPAAGRGHVRALRVAAQESDVRLTIAPHDLAVEVWCLAAQPALVVSCFSTALMTCARYAGAPVATMGCDLVLERLVPYENSNRIPATIVDATVPVLHADGSCADPPPREVARLVRAVGFCMQAARNPGLRADARAYVSTYGPARYFKTRRLRAAGLLDAPAYQSSTAYRTLRAGKRMVVKARRR